MHRAAACGRWWPSGSDRSAAGAWRRSAARGGQWCHAVVGGGQHAPGEHRLGPARCRCQAGTSPAGRSDGADAGLGAGPAGHRRAPAHRRCRRARR
ncbi:hypothetical protein G6F60_014878 [Rhizopus arrhizus]|nr:hypothetical protein G6F60_014878 [Rhizopus arrhizus]